MSSRRWLVPFCWAVAFTVAAGYGYHQSSARQRVIRGWFDQRPGLTRIDLSRPGTTTIVIPPTTDVHHHAYRFYLDPGRETFDRLPQGTIRVDNSRGESFVIEIAEALFTEPGRHGREIGYTSWEPDGHTMTVEVRQGSDDFAGIESSVYGRYVICELVSLPAMGWGLFALLAGIPAVVAWACALRRLLARRPTAPLVVPEATK